MTQTLHFEGTELCDRYRIRDKLGKGGMSHVWRAFDSTLSINVALSVPFFNNEYQLRLARVRLEREAHILHDLLAPVLDIPDLIDIRLDHDPPFIVTQYIEGTSLDTYLDRPWDAGDAVRLTLSVAAILHRAHQFNVVHRDIKPSNLMVRPNGTVAIIDFDIAQVIGEEALDGFTPIAPHDPDATIDSLGTFKYACSEQVDDDVVDVRCDLYSLGLTCYELLCGKLPKYHTAEDALAPPLVTNPDISPALSDAVMLALGPINTRPNSVAEWAADLRRAAFR